MQGFSVFQAEFLQRGPHVHWLIYLAIKHVLRPPKWPTVRRVMLPVRSPAPLPGEAPIR